MFDTKICSASGCEKAGQQQLLSAFPYDKRTGDYKSQCRDCVAKKHRETINKTQAHRDYSHNYYHTKVKKPVDGRKKKPQ